MPAAAPEPRRRAGAGASAAQVFALLRALGIGEDVIARIVFARARLVIEGSTVDELVNGDPNGVGGRDVEVQIPGRRVVEVVMPERRMSACVPFEKGLALLAVMLV